MRTIKHALAIAITMSFAGVAFAARSVEVAKVTGQALVAAFEEFTPDCSGIDSAVDVHWNSSITKLDGDKTTQPAVILDLHYVNTCTGDDLMMTGFSLDPQGSVVDDLSRGHFDAVIPVSTDPDFPPVRTATLNASIDFTATGPATTIRDQFHSRDGAVSVNSDFMVSSRPATATGSVTGTLPLASGPTFVTLVSGRPSLFAQIEKDASGTITITRK